MRVFFPTLILVLASAGTALAQGDKPAVDPKFEAAVTRMEKALEGIPPYTVNVKLEWQGGDGDSGRSRFVFHFERPGRFRIEARAGDVPEPTLIAVGDGRVVTTYLPEKKLYAKAPLPHPSRLLEMNPILATSIKGSLIDSLIRPGLKAFVLERTRAASLVGKETVDGVSLEHFRLTWGRDEEEFWVGPEERTLPRKLIRVSNFPGKDAAALRLTTTATLNWAIGGPMDPKWFALELPKDATQVQDLEAALTSGTPETLLGKPAPELSAPKLGGGTVSLAEFRGKRPVVLGFWASWNAGSVQTLPAFAKLGADFKDVAFFALNAGDETPTVAAFIKKEPLAPDVLLDPEDKAIERFGVTELPTFILIDKAGLVQKVHIGAGDAVIKALRDDLGALTTAPKP